MSECAIIVPSFNRPARLEACLEALVRQDHEDYEIIVVDDGSAQPLSLVCAKFGDRVRCIRKDNSGPASARNVGGAATNATFLAFTDDDCRPWPDWLRALHMAYGEDEDRLVGGLVKNGLPRDRYASASQSLCDFLYDHFEASAGSMPFFTSNNIGCSRAGFLRLGGFDESFPLAAAEDRDFGMRWREVGGELTYAPDAIVDHFHEMTFQQFWLQHSNYGAGAHHLHQVLKGRGSNLPRREQLSFYRDLLFWPIRQEGLQGIGQTALLTLTQLAMINGYMRAAR